MCYKCEAGIPHHCLSSGSVVMGNAHGRGFCQSTTNTSSRDEGSLPLGTDLRRNDEVPFRDHVHRSGDPENLAETPGFHVARRA